MSVEVLDPFNAQSIVGLSIVTHSDCPVTWDILIPAGLVELARQDHER
jgi:hypothetical protein